MQPICTMDSLRLQLSICIFFSLLFNFSADSIFFYTSYFWLWAITKCSISFLSTEMCTAVSMNTHTHTYSIGCKKEWWNVYLSMGISVISIMSDGELVLKHRIPLNMMQTKSSHTHSAFFFSISNQPELLQIIVRALIISING